MVSCVHFQVDYGLAQLLPAGLWEGREVLKWPRCLTYRAVHTSRAAQNPPADTRSPHWHATQCSICFGTKCKSVQVFRLRTNVGRELDKSKSCWIETDEGKGFFYRHVRKIRAVASGWLGSFASDKCGYMKKIRISIKFTFELVPTAVFNL